MLLSHYTIENKKEHAKEEKGRNAMDKASFIYITNLKSPVHPFLIRAPVNIFKENIHNKFLFFILRIFRIKLSTLDFKIIC